MSRFCSILLILAAAAALVISCPWTGNSTDAAETSLRIPPGGRQMLTGDPAPDLFWTPRNDPSLAKTALVPAQGMPFRKAVYVQVVKRPPQPWDVTVGAPLSGDIEKGDVCLLSLSVRGAATEERHGAAQASLFLEQRSRPHRKMLAYPVRAGSDWQTIFVPFRAEERLADGTIQMIFHLGWQPQTFEVGGISMLNYGKGMTLEDLPRTPVTYEGRGADAPWRKKALEKIEKLRKAQLTVEVVDQHNKPVAGAEVHVRMLRHAFGFGSAVGANLLGVNLDDTETVQQSFGSYGTARDIQHYRDLVAKLFNKAVFENALKFMPWIESQAIRPATFRQEWTDRALQWLHQHDIGVRGHWIACGDLDDYPKDLVLGARAYFRSRLFASIRDKVPAIGARVEEWDAINHPVDGTDNLANHLGSPEVYVDIMKLSRKLAPGIPLWVNEGVVLAEGTRRDAYEELVRYLVAQGVSPDGIGFMGHFDRLSLTPPEEILHVMDRFARIIPSLQITELDVDVGGEEQLQADYLRDVMIAAFSHPACKGVVLWGFWEKKHWKPAAALYRADWSMKPAGKAWNDLVFHDWWTDETARTDAQGRLVVSGFLGQYEVTCSAGEKKGRERMDLPHAGAVAHIMLK